MTSRIKQQKKSIKAKAEARKKRVKVSTARQLRAKRYDGLDHSLRDWIDHASAAQLLARHRFSPGGDPIFHGGTSAYFNDALVERKRRMGPEAWASLEKEVGKPDPNTLTAKQVKAKAARRRERRHA